MTNIEVYEHLRQIIRINKAKSFSFMYELMSAVNKVWIISLVLSQISKQKVEQGTEK